MVCTSQKPDTIGQFEVHIWNQHTLILIKYRIISTASKIVVCSPYFFVLLIIGYSIKYM